MLSRSVVLGVLAISLLFGFNEKASAIAANSSLATTARIAGGVTNVRWVCGPYRCAWIPNYRGRVVVYPHMRGWVRPPSPHCYYVQSFFGWRLVCP
jgi:hypothetical protein